MGNRGTFWPRDPLSVLSALAFPAIGYVIGLLSRWDGASRVMFGALLLLCVGTMLHHWTGLSDSFGRDWDHAGMVATYAALATAAVGSWPWMLGAAVLAVVLMEVKWDVPYRGMIGACVWIAIVAGFVSGVWWITLAGVVSLAGAMLVQGGDDLHHSAWHLLAAFGTMLLYLSFP